MAQRSFGLVEDKVLEADFFLERLSRGGGDLFVARCYFSAFVSASRSITFALQAVMTGVSGFEQWYSSHQMNLKSNSLARYFHAKRTLSQHIGENPVNAGYSGTYYFELFEPGASKDTPTADVVTACTEYMVLILHIVRDCFRKFGSVIDPDEYYTLPNLRKLNLSIDDVEEEMGFPRGWTSVAGGTDQDRLDALRRNIPRSSLPPVFQKYKIQ